MQTLEAWDAAQRLFGTNFLIYGIVLLLVVPIVISGSGPMRDPYVLLLGVVAAELILMAVPVLAVERHLK